MDKPTCKVRGKIEPGAMCGYIIVGAKRCGFSGDCVHKSCADMIVEKVKADAEAHRAAVQEAASQAQSSAKGGDAVGGM